MGKEEYICGEINAYFARNRITKAEAARRLGASHSSTVTNQLSGRPFGRNNARKWAETFGFSETFLLTGDGTLLPEEKPAPEPVQQVQQGGVWVPKELVDMFTNMSATIRMQETELAEYRGKKEGVM